MILEEEYSNYLEFGDGVSIDNETNRIIINGEKLNIDYKWLEKMCYKYFGENNHIVVSIINNKKLNLYDKYRHMDYKLDIY